MKLRMSLMVLVTLCAATCFISCQKGVNETIEIPKKDLIPGKWQITGTLETPATFDFDADGVKDSDIYKYMGTCFKDNFIIFKEDGTVEDNEGPTRCEPTDPQLTTAAWSLAPDNKTLTIDNDLITILELNATTMK